FQMVNYRRAGGPAEPRAVVADVQPAPRERAVRVGPAVRPVGPASGLRGSSRRLSRAFNSEPVRPAGAPADPGGLSLIKGSTAAQARAMMLCCLFVLAVNGSVASGILVVARGTALAPITAEVGPIAAVLGSLFVVLGMGMATIHFSFGSGELG